MDLVELDMKKYLIWQVINGGLVLMNKRFDAV